MLSSDEKTMLPSLLSYTKSDLFTFENISSPVTLKIETDDTIKKWDIIISYLPMEFSRIIENTSGIYTIEKFDKKYALNPKKYAYDKYGITNMWRPIMILNRCASLLDFNFEYIKKYNMSKFQEVMSVLISRYNL